jgi:peptidoglycan/LPS O-acetylase OafA/YrhL
MSTRSEFHIPSLDGIRGLAALTVFVSHAGLPNLVPGGFGVTVFFFLSGYLITTLLRIEYEQTGNISFSRFYLRRVYRILPPMYIVLTACLLLAFAGLLHHQMKVPGVLAQFAHFTNYYFIFRDPHDFVPSTSVMWSLAVEEHFYLLFPLALVLLLRRFELRQIGAALAVICVAVLAWRCWLVLGLGWGHRYTYYATDTRIDSLLYGCIMGVWLNPVLDRPRIHVGQRTAMALLIGGAALLLSTFLYRSDTFRETARYTLQGIALFPLFFCAIRYPEWPIFRWLETRPMRALGLISYTFYLVHLPCLALLAIHTKFNQPTRAVLGFIATITVCTAMYYFVERHMGALRRRLHKAPAKAPASPAGAVTAME